MSDKSIDDFRFILDVHLGKLVRLLRLFGFDSYINANFDDLQIIRFSLSDNRIILTRDKELLNNSLVEHGYRVLSQQPDEQLKEVFRSFDLKNHIRPFTRCLECNGMLIAVKKEDVEGELLQNTLEFYHSFRKCSRCHRIYWEGSHYERMKKYMDSVINDVI